MNPSPHSDALTELPFLIFVSVADAKQSVGAAEADAFIRLLQKGSWARCHQLAAVLPDAAKQYSEHWRRYLAGEISSSGNGVMRSITNIASGWPPRDASLLEKDLLHITTTLRKAARLPRWRKESSSTHSFDALEAALGASLLKQEMPASTSGLAEKPVSPAPVLEDWEQACIAGAQPWKSVATPLRCVKTSDETADVRTFTFVAEPARSFCYKPGQFMTIEMEIAGKKVRRSYTISSSPSRPQTISITVKRVPGGLASNWLHDNLRAGHSLKAWVANGKFNAWDIPATKLLLLSAGSGITPVMSISRWQWDLAIQRDVVFLHSARTPEDIIFRRELEVMQGPHFKVIVNCTRVASDGPWVGPRGRLDAGMLKSAVPDFMERVVFMCGPDAWMTSTKAIFAAAGFPMQNFHQESFGGPAKSSAGPPVEESSPVKPAANSSARTSAPTASVSTGSGSGKIVFAKSNREIACSADEPILEIAERNGIEIPSSCRAGACGTCKVIRKSGVVKHDASPGLPDADAAQGYVLTCVGLVEGTVVLEA
jgi:ferredoxin-NADP reductase